MKGILESNDRGTPGVQACDFDGIFYRLRTSVEEGCLLFTPARRNRVHQLGKLHIVFVRGNRKARMNEVRGLLLNSTDDGLRGMTGIQAADATGKIQEAVAVDIFDNGAVRRLDENRKSTTDSPCHRCCSFLRQCLGLRTRDCGNEMDGCTMRYGRGRHRRIPAFIVKLLHPDGWGHSSAAA